VLVAAVMLAALVGAGVWLAVRSHEYRATAEVLVSLAAYEDDSYIGLPVLQDTPRDPVRAVQTAAELLDSPGAARATARRLGRGWTARRVRAAVSVEHRGESSVLAVQATASGARLAARIADTFARAALEQRRAELSRLAKQLLARRYETGSPPARQLDRLKALIAGIDPTFSPLNSATTPSSSVATAPWRIIALALFAGAVLGCAAALITEVAAHRFRAQDEVVEMPGLASRAPARRS
jgi:capsular polysaccharide biosynthesis protein